MGLEVTAGARGKFEVWYAGADNRPCGILTRGGAALNPGQLVVATDYYLDVYFVFLVLKKNEAHSAALRRQYYDCEVVDEWRVDALPTLISNFATKYMAFSGTVVSSVPELMPGTFHLVHVSGSKSTATVLILAKLKQAGKTLYGNPTRGYYQVEVISEV